MTLIIAAAQSASVSGDVPANLTHHLAFCAVAAAHGVQLLVFPELSLTGYEPAIARSNAIGADDSRLYPLWHRGAEVKAAYATISRKTGSGETSSSPQIRSNSGVAQP